MMFRFVSVLLVLVGLTVTASANLVQQGDFSAVTGPGGGIASPPWYDSSTDPINHPYVQTFYDYDLGQWPQDGGYDMAHLWYAQSVYTGQLAIQFVNLTANQHYTLSADLKAWTSNVPGTYAKAEVRVWMYNSFLGAGWVPAPIDCSFTGTTAADINTWHTVTAEFDVPAGADVGWWQIVTLASASNTPLYESAFRWDNISLTGVELPPPPPVQAVPEPVTMIAVLMGLGGLGGYLRRRTVA